MPLANYTTSVPVSRTVAEIQQMLGSNGAQAVMVDYEAGQPSAVSFRIIKHNLQLAFRLPCDWRKTLVVLNKDPKVPGRLKTNEHAQRVAWRVQRDWLRAQLALIETNQATLDQVMLPYCIMPTGGTLYSRFENSRFETLALPTSSQFEW